MPQLGRRSEVAAAVRFDAGRAAGEGPAVRWRRGVSPSERMRSTNRDVELRRDGESTGSGMGRPSLSKSPKLLAALKFARR